jgi:hypothetical protein
MKIIERDTKVIAYDEDMNEVVIQLIEDDDGDEKLFIGSKREWKNYAQNHSVVAL